jgi:spore maturation protein CgeB/GT2 family glycosyltransferase
MGNAVMESKSIELSKDDEIMRPGNFEMVSYLPASRSVLLSGWLRTDRQGEVDVEVRICNGAGEIRGEATALFFEREDLSGIGKCFIAQLSVVDNGLDFAAITSDPDAVFLVSIKGEIAHRQSLAILSLSRESHLNTVRPYMENHVDDKAQRLLEALDDEFAEILAEAIDANTEGEPSVGPAAKGKVQRFGPIHVTGWVRIPESGVLPSMQLRWRKERRNVEAKFTRRIDSSKDRRTRSAQQFELAIPPDIPINDLKLTKVFANGRCLKEGDDFIFESPAYFQLLTVYGSAFEAIAFDPRNPEQTCDIELVTEDGRVFSVDRRFSHSLDIQGERVEGLIGVAADLADITKGGRVRVVCRLAGSDTIFGEIILDGSLDGMRPRKAPIVRSNDGKVDQIGPHFVGGWVRIEDNIEPQLELRINDASCGRTTARRSRPDVEEATGQGARGFLLPLPHNRLLPTANKIEVVRLDTREVLRSVESTISGPPNPGQARLSDDSIVGFVETRFISSSSRIELIVGQDVVGSCWLGTDTSRIAERIDFVMPLPDRTLEPGRMHLRLLPQGLSLSLLDQPAKLTGELRSNFDGLHSDTLTGWLFDAGDHNRSLGVLVTIDGILMGQYPATDMRGDLKSTGIKSFNHGFKITIPAPLMDGRTHLVSVINAESMSPLKSSPQVIRFPKRLPDLPFPRTPHLNGLRSPLAPLCPPKIVASENPEFSLIILNKDAGEVLERAFESIADYFWKHDFEILLVDHASTDNSMKVIERWSECLPIKLFVREGNNTFSYSNNFAVRHARGRRVVFVNNDIVFTQDVLSSVRNYMDANADVGLVGIKLLELRKSRFADSMNDFKVHHLGIAYAEDRTTATIKPREIVDDAENAWRCFVPTDVASVTGAFCVMNRDEFLSIGGFDEQFFYGYEDVTLGLKVMQLLSKRVVSLNDVTSFHHRGFMRLSGKMDEEFMQRVRHNDKIIADLYGRLIRQQYLKSLYAGDWVYTTKKLTVAFIVFDASPVTRAGDYFTARELASELVKTVSCNVFFIDAATGWHTAGDFDVIINMRNEFDIRDLSNPKPNMLKVAWLRNNFEDWLEGGALETYDYVLSSSEAFLEEIREKTGISGSRLEIAANAGKMERGVSQPCYVADVIFNGSFAGADRDLTAEFAEKELPFSFRVFGSGWEGSALERYSSGFVEYESMPDLYASAKIVIDDANTSARKWGGTNSRVFDALSAGCLIITNSAQTSEASFDSLLPVWTDGDDLICKIQHYLTHPEERLALVEKLRTIVMERHTYAERATSLSKLIKLSARCRRIAIRVCAPSRNTKEVWGDVHYAEQLAFELRRLGYLVVVQTRQEWEKSAGREDVVIDLRGLKAFPKVTTALNIVWVISHPDDVSATELGQYDHVFAASEESCRRFREMGASTASVLLQCATLRRKPKKTDIALKHRLLYACNTRGEMRVGAKMLEQIGAEYDLIGYGWENFASVDNIRATSIPYDDLLSLYEEAAITINDHWDDMRKWGIISNRVFDVAAAGGCVVTDSVIGLEKVFSDDVSSYEDAATFKTIIDKLLSDEILRRESAARAQQTVLNEHLFEHRAKVFDETIQFLSDW